MVLLVTRLGTFMLPAAIAVQSVRLLLLQRLSQQSLGRPGQLVRPTELGRLLGLIFQLVLRVTQPGTFLLPIQTTIQSVRLLLLQGLSQHSPGWPGHLVRLTEVVRLLGLIFQLVLHVTRPGPFMLPIQTITQSVRLRSSLKS